MPPKKKKFYAYLLPSGKSGVTDDWKVCESMVSGIHGARYRGFPSGQEARAWLSAGARYEVKLQKRLEPGIYFDAGTGRGNGVEISVTDETGKNLLHKALSKKELNAFGKHNVVLDDGEATNNYGELLALRYALAIAKKEKEAYFRRQQARDRSLVAMACEAQGTSGGNGATRGRGREIARSIRGVGWRHPSDIRRRQSRRSGIP